MAKLSLLSLSVSLLILFGGCLAQLGSQQQFLWQELQQQQKHPLRAKTDCRIDRLNAQGPSRKYQSEAGTTEFWDPNDKQFVCAGVEAVRNFIQPKGLLLPHYNNAPQLIYIVGGRGLLGAVIPGCAETFESEIQQQGSESQRRFLDRHQKIRQFRQGDVLALPAGVTLWVYNNGDEPLVTVALLDTANEQNQLDLNFRNFFLAGNPYSYSGQQGQGQQGEQGQAEGPRGKNNIFNGFEDEILADAFRVEAQIISRLKGQNDQRGHIVRAEKFNVVFPRAEEEERQREYSRGEPNGLEETLCTARLRENLAYPTRADVYNPRAGRLATLNSQTLPILSSLQLSAVRGVLYGNAIMAPHWNVNAHSAIYITKGNGRFQVVGHSGKLVFDGVVQEGQLIIIPQNFVVVKKAGERGCEWIAFKTNDNAMISPLAGRLSAIRSMPVPVLMNAYQISRTDAQNLKYSRDEAQLFSSSSQSSRSPKPKAIEYAFDVIKSVI